MPGSTGDQLRELLVRQAKMAGEEAVRSDGRVAVQQVEALERLARLVKLYDAAQPSPPRQRWPLTLAFGTTLLIVSVLLFARVGETEIEVELAVSEVSFVLGTQEKLADEMALSALGISGFQETRLPRARNRDAETLVSADAGSGLRLSVASGGGRHGSISLETLMLPTGTRVSVGSTGLPREYRLSLTSAGQELRAAVNGPVRVVVSGGGIRQLDFATPQAVLLRSGAHEVDLDLALLDSGRTVFSPQLSTTGLSFTRIDEATDAGSTVVRRVSAILAGTLYFESLNGEERKLRAGEVIQFERAQGEIRTLRLAGDHIDLAFHGRVGGFSIGPGEVRRSLMPTWLDWLKARHGLSLLWGTALYLFGLIVGVLRWLGSTV